MEKQLFAYVRVSTTRQGERGVSLQEQKDSIEKYARRYELKIQEWFEERESAAKRGRTVFTRMLKLLRQKKAVGVIIHKIDRSARNLKDWADLGEMIDAGIEVHFANESLDLNTRGGRLSADIQAVVASDFIRNLREETRKGFYGRLKQGIYPLPAPIGYLDAGKGKAKVLDSIMAPLVAQAFELYGTNTYSLHRLLKEVRQMGLKGRNGGDVSLNGLSTMLNNPFYIGFLRVRTTGELFPGQQHPLISKALFDRVQRILQGKTVPRSAKHDFMFRRMLRCATCGYSLIGERQKGHVYYRCHIDSCPPTAVREEAVENALISLFDRLELTAEELDYEQRWLSATRLQQGSVRERALANLRLRLDAVRTRIHRLTDAMIDGLVDKPLFDDRKSALLFEERSIRDEVLAWDQDANRALSLLEKFLELMKTPSLLYKTANQAERRLLVQKVTSNLTVGGKNVTVAPNIFAQMVAERPRCSNSSPTRGVPRTWEPILVTLLDHFAHQPELVT